MKELKKILYAEDETDIQVVVEAIISSMSSYDLKICNNGKELLTHVETYKPDVILLDVMMPEMDGLTTFKHLQKNKDTKDIPVIFMTAKAQMHEVEMLQETGIIGIITKPFDPMKLCDSLKEIWGKYNDAR